MNNLLVACLGKIYMLDPDAETWRCVLEQGEHFYTYGITWDEDNFWLGSVGQMEDKGAYLCKYDKNLMEVDRVKLDVGGKTAPHQMLYNPHDRLLYWTMAYKNAIYVMDRTGKGTFWKPNDEAVESFRDRHGDEEAFKKKRTFRNKEIIVGEEPLNHWLNSVWFDDDDNALVMCHNKGPSEVIVCDGREFKERHRAGNQCHNVWKEDGKIWYCDSGGERTVRSTCGEKIELKIPGFVRGVAFANGKRYLGVSPYAAQKADRSKANSCILVMDKEWDVEKVIDVPVAGQVYEIRALGADLCHNGLQPPGVL